jgi:ABC-2 type transport system permease protein/oleandomycin transport system permease protein
VSGGTTVLLTTQYLEDADRLAHRIVIIDHGHVIASGSADQLKDQLGRDVIEVRVADSSGFGPAAAALAPSLAGMGLVLAFSFAMSWEMSWVALKVKDPETAQVAGFLPLVPLVFASSGFVPVASMPGWLQGFANARPVSVTISAVRVLTRGGPTAHYLWQSAAWIAGILVVFGALAVMEYRKM